MRNIRYEMLGLKRAGLKHILAAFYREEYDKLFDQMLSGKTYAKYLPYHEQTRKLAQ